VRRTSALIVGGGPAGTAAAIRLAQAGHRPRLIERTLEPHDTVCGAFLGWDSLAALRRLGFDAEAAGARPIHRVRLIAEDGRVEARLPKAAAGLSRRCLDEWLLAAARDSGAEVLRGRTARAADPSSRVVRLEDGEEMAADTCSSPPASTSFAAPPALAIRAPTRSGFEPPSRRRGGWTRRSTA